MMAGKEMEAVSKFIKRAKAQQVLFAKQYINSRLKYGKMGLFETIHKYSLSYEHTFLKKKNAHKFGSLEGLKELQIFFKEALIEVSSILQKYSLESSSLTHTSEIYEKNIKINDNLNEFLTRRKVELGRKLHNLGRVRLNREGEKYLQNHFTKDQIKFFNDAIEFGNILDKTSKKVAKVISKNKTTSQGKSTVTKKPQTFGLYIKFPTQDIHKKLQLKGMVDIKYRPISFKKILNSSDIDIINYYNSVAYGLLNYYSCCHNF